MVLAVGILLILTLIALTVFYTSQRELTIAQNNQNAIKASLVADGGLAWAIAFLKHDRHLHPTYTSLDHAWRSYFNGSWAAGKEWAFNHGGLSPQFDNTEFLLAQRDILASSLPDVDNFLLWRRTFDPGHLDRLYIPRLQRGPVDASLAAELAAPLNFDGDFLLTTKLDEGPGTHPRFFDLDNSDEYPIIDLDGDGQAGYILPIGPVGVELLSGFVERQIHSWAHIDNNDDGYRDAIWIPFPGDLFFPDDGIDNDLDGIIDESHLNGFDDDGDGEIDESDEAIEMGTFVYWGTDDGRDNDDDGLVDEVDEDRLFLTTPLLDLNGNKLWQSWSTGSPAMVAMTGSSTVATPVLDLIDNDYDFVINDNDQYPPVGWHRDPNREYKPGRVFTPIDTVYYSGLAPYSPNANNPLRMSYTGEPACEVVGRLAITITDESSKVNFNATGGLTRREVEPEGGREFPSGDWNVANDPIGPVVQRSFGSGVSNFEYDLAELPGIGDAFSSHFWGYRTGAAGGLGFSLDVNSSTIDAEPLDGPVFAWDASFPGYGWVDDNGNAFHLSMNGLDDDGDGLVDEGIYLPDTPGPFSSQAEINLYNRYLTALGSFEGVDEPSEQQLMRPLRNIMAETDNEDNDLDDVFNEIGEYGDKNFKSREQIRLIDQIGIGRFNSWGRHLSVHSAERNDRFRFKKTASNENLFVPEVSGLRLDYSYALAGQVAAMLKNDFGFRPTFGGQYLDRSFDPSQFVTLNSEFNLDVSSGRKDKYDPARFAVGLRQEAADVFGSVGLLAIDDFTPTEGIEADGELRAMQLGATLVDTRDPDLARTELTTTTEDIWWAAQEYTNNPSNGIRTGPSISYTVAGIEAIRINELMVRPVRRIEAEALINDADVDMNAALLSRYNPNSHSLPLSLDGFVDGPDRVFFDFEVEHEFVEQDLWLDPWSNAGKFMGERTSISTIDLVDPDTQYDPPNAGEFKVNMVEFVFRASPELPPGRYYLLVNTRNDNGVATITEDTIDNINYIIEVGTDSIVDQADDKAYVTANQIDGAMVYQSASNPIRETALQEQGTVYLPNRNSPDGLLTVEVPATDPNVVADDDLALRVAIWFDGDPSFPANEELAINFFDFSQEPDHEWIELVNIQKFDPSRSVEVQAIDLSDWQLEIGSLSTGALGDRQLMTIPRGTQIPPGGTLLLGFNKYDDFENDPIVDGRSPVHFITDTQPSQIFQNGLGLVRGELPGGSGLKDLPALDEAVFINVTEPPIPNLAGLRAGAVRAFERHGTLGLGDLEYTQRVNFPPYMSSVFTGMLVGGTSVITGEPLPVDFVDNDGNGFPDVLFRASISGDGDADGFADFAVYNHGAILATVTEVTNGDIDGDALTDYGVPTVPNLGVNGDIDLDGDGLRETSVEDMVRSTPQNEAGEAFPNRAYDRIVEMQSPKIDGVLSDQDVANLLLEGGMLPNYPERNGIDDDGDASILLSDGVDNDGDGAWDSITTDLDEGYDEGGNFLEDPSQATPGHFEAGNVTFRSNAGGFRSDEHYYLGAAYVGDPENDLHAVRWKEFVERRWFPGDNVIVTLYEGSVIDEKVVDRVTYTERDVTNRSFDDMFSVDLDPLAGNGPDRVNSYYDPEPLGNGNPRGLNTAWPANTMGIDFYKSLERKHPLYNGDRFGTRNRWQATDGNYDDWDDRTGRYSRIGLAGLFGYNDEVTDNVGATYSADAILARNSRSLLRAYGHAFDASPLRMNLAQRTFENTNDQFPDPNVYDHGGTLPLLHWSRSVAGNKSSLSKLQADNTVEIDNIPNWAYERAALRNRPFVSLGDLVSLPHVGLNEQLLTARSDDPLLVSDNAGSRSIMTEVLLAREAPDTFNALYQAGTHDDQVLTVGQAMFYPVYPTVAQIQNDSTLIQFGNSVVPQAWTPVFIQPMNRIGRTEDTNVLFPAVSTYNATDPKRPYQHLPATYPVQENFLFNRPNDMPTLIAPVWPPPGLREEDIGERALLDTRAVMYVSGNMPFFDPSHSTRRRTVADVTDATPNSEAAAEALFVWTAEDGLENGQYDLYVVTVEPLTQMEEAARRIDYRASGIFTSFSDEILARSQGILRDMAMDFEVFTDNNGDRRCWIDDNVTFPNDPNLPNPLEFDLGDSIIPRDGGRPTTEGIIYLGTARIQNNYLGLRVRNWAPQGTMNRISRIVLAPRERTPGRLNINTVATSDTVVSGTTTPINTLAGVPGISSMYNVNTTLLFHRIDDTVGIPVATQRQFSDPDIEPLGYLRLLTARREETQKFRSEVETGNPNFISAGFEDWRVSSAEHFDGRYFKSPAELIQLTIDEIDRLGQTQDITLFADPLINDPGAIFPRVLLSPTESRKIRDGDYDLEAPSRTQQRLFDEMARRHEAIANLVSTRSDVFEIIITAQSGYLSNEAIADDNGDGVINSLDQIDIVNDFVTEGEKRIRVIYERR
jgi:hypothetical protein